LKLFAVPERVLESRKKKSSELTLGELSGTFHKVRLSNNTEVWYEDDLLPQSFKDENADEALIEEVYNAEGDPDYQYEESEASEDLEDSE